MHSACLAFVCKYISGAWWRAQSNPAGMQCSFTTSLPQPAGANRACVQYPCKLVNALKSMLPNVIISKSRRIAALTICLRHAAPFGMEKEGFHLKRHVFLEAVNLGSLQAAEVQGHTVNATPVAGPDAAAALPGGELGEPT